MATINSNSRGLNSKILNLMKDAGIGRPSGYSREFLLALTPTSFAALSVKNQYDCMTKISWLAVERNDTQCQAKFLELYSEMIASQAKISEYMQFQLNREMQRA